VGLEAEDDCEIGWHSAKELGGLASEDGQYLIRIEIVDLKGARARSFARSCTRRMDGGQVSWSLAEVNFSRSGTAESLVWSKVRVIIEPLVEAAFEVSFGQRLERTQSQGVFEGSPESLDDGNGTVLADGTEALPGTEPSQRFPKPLGGELPSLIGDEVPGWAEMKRGPFEQPAYLSGGAFFPEDFGDEGHAGEDIEDDHELEGKQSKETGDGGDVSHPDVMGMAGAESPGRLGCFFGNGVGAQWELERQI